MCPQPYPYGYIPQHTMTFLPPIFSPNAQAMPMRALILTNDRGFESDTTMAPENTPQFQRDTQPATANLSRRTVRPFNGAELRESNQQPKNYWRVRSRGGCRQRSGRNPWFAAKRHRPYRGTPTRICWTRKKSGIQSLRGHSQKDIGAVVLRLYRRPARIGKMLLAAEFASDLDCDVISGCDAQNRIR